MNSSRISPPAPCRRDGGRELTTVVVNPLPPAQGRRAPEIEASQTEPFVPPVQAGSA